MSKDGKIEKRKRLLNGKKATLKHEKVTLKLQNQGRGGKFFEKSYMNKGSPNREELRCRGQLEIKNMYSYICQSRIRIGGREKMNGSVHNEERDLNKGEGS